MARRLFPPYTRRYVLYALVTRGWRLFRQGGRGCSCVSCCGPETGGSAKRPPVLDDLDATYQAWLASRPPLDTQAHARRLFRTSRGKGLLSLIQLMTR